MNTDDILDHEDDYYNDDEQSAYELGKHEGRNEGFGLFLLMFFIVLVFAFLT